jgi:hypothetical protein
MTISIERILIQYCNQCQYYLDKYRSTVKGLVGILLIDNILLIDIRYDMISGGRILECCWRMERIWIDGEEEEE